MPKKSRKDADYLHYLHSCCPQIHCRSTRPKHYYHCTATTTKTSYLIRSLHNSLYLYLFLMYLGMRQKQTILLLMVQTILLLLYLLLCTIYLQLFLLLLLHNLHYIYLCLNDSSFCLSFSQYFLCLLQNLLM